MFYYISVYFAPYHSHKIKKAKAAGNSTLNLEDCFTELLTEIYQIANPNSDSYRPDHQNFLQEFNQVFKGSSALFYADEKADEALKAAISKITNSPPVIKVNINTSKLTGENPTASADINPRLGAANEGGAAIKNHPSRPADIDCRHFLRMNESAESSIANNGSIPAPKPLKGNSAQNSSHPANLSTIVSPVAPNERSPSQSPSKKGISLSRSKHSAFTHINKSQHQPNNPRSRSA